MEYKIYEFCKKDKSTRKKHFKTFFRIQDIDFLISYIFIFLSSGKQIFSPTNGAVWVFLWYTLSILTSWYIHINQFEYNTGIKKAIRFSKKHPKYTVEKGKRFSAEIGGWNFISAQFLCAWLVELPLAIFAITSQSYSFSNYMDKYKDFCVGIFADTYVLVFFTIYYRGFMCDLKLVSGWKNKVSYFLHTFDGTKGKNFLIHILSFIIIICAFIYYFFNEFSGLFNLNTRRIIGFIYILYMIDAMSILKELIGKIKKQI